MSFEASHTSHLNMNDRIKIANEILRVADSFFAPPATVSRAGQYRDFTGKIDTTFVKGEVESADFNITSAGKVVFDGGTWIDGFFESSTWNDGVWEDGTFINGVWHDGYWGTGVWQGGYDGFGNWHDREDTPNIWND